MKKLITFLVLFLFAGFAEAGFRGYNGTTDLKIFNAIKCSDGLTCSKSADKFVMVANQTGVGYPLVAASSTAALTASQCGSTIYNAGGVVSYLPDASAEAGCQYTFVSLTADNFDVDPESDDTILLFTNAAGDKLRNSSLGGAVTLRAVGDNSWAVVSDTGNWTDAN